MRIAELEARLLANAETQRNAQIAIERLTLALSEAQAAFEAEHPRLRAAIDPLEEAVKTAQAQVASSLAALDTLQGERAIDFLRRPLQAPITGFQDTELELLVEQRVTKVSKTSETSLKNRSFEHFMPRHIKDWEEFEGLKQAWVDEIGDCIIPKPDELLTETIFDSEREFNNYWERPRLATSKVTSILSPHLPLSTAKFRSKKPDGTGVTDEYMIVGGRSLQVTEYKHPGVRFFTDVTVAALASLPPPPEGEIGRGPKGNVLKSLIQTYTYMVSDRTSLIKFGAFSNWDFWVFFNRVVENGEEVLYLSPWYHRSVARLAWAIFITLAAAPHVGDDALSLTSPVPDWLLPKKDEPKDGDKDQLGRGSVQSKSASAGSSNKKGPSGGPSDALEELYPDTTTAEALGIRALLWVQPFQMLSLSEKSHTRRVLVNGRDLVVKIVDYYRTPSHTEWSQEDLYELE